MLRLQNNAAADLSYAFFRSSSKNRCVVPGDVQCVESAFAWASRFARFLALPAKTRLSDFAQ